MPMSLDRLCISRMMGSFSNMAFLLWPDSVGVGRWMVYIVITLLSYVTLCEKSLRLCKQVVNTRQKKRASVGGGASTDVFLGD
jgi:hypothetical protein